MSLILFPLVLFNISKVFFVRKTAELRRRLATAAAAAAVIGSKITPFPGYFPLWMITIV